MLLTLKELRTANGMSRQELADRIGVSVPTVCRYETGARKIPVETAMKIGKIFDVPWHMLYSTGK